MAEQLDLHTFTGAHPCNREFVEHLRAWKFTQRKVDGVHLVFRGPHGGTLRVVRSLLGRSDPAVVSKAARLVRVDVADFWAGPAAVRARAGVPAQRTDDGAPVTDLAQRRQSPTRDQITSLVLATHTAADRPLGFDRVVQMCAGTVTRDQVRHASSVLCRDGDLDRIRTGVYQWAQGARAPMPSTAPVPVIAPQTPAGSASDPEPERVSTADLFELLFPRGVRMDAELLADFERWRELTEKMIASAAPS